MRIVSKLKSKNRSWLCTSFWAVLFISFCLILPQSGFAAWSSSPLEVEATDDDSCRTQVVYDDAGGYYAVWRNTDTYTIMAQHYDANGDATWSSPLQVSNEGDNEYFQESTGDGSGGLLVAWGDYTDYDCRVQRVNMDGTVVWATGGVKVITGEYDVWIAADGTGGAIVMSYGGYVNRIAADGTLPWGAYDSPIQYSSGSSYTKIAADGNGGAILLWGEYSAFSGLAVQKIDSNGNFVWNSGDPIQLTSYQECSRIISQDGGAIVAWEYSNDILAQKIDSSGNIQWTSGGVTVGSFTSGISTVDLAGDDAGGAYITWIDWSDYTPYAQYVNTSGTVVWSAPVALTSAGDAYDYMWHPRRTVEDGSGGFITAWVNSDGTDYGVVAQRCNAAGELQWTDTAALLATAEYVEYEPKLTSNGQGGAVAIWTDSRDATSSYDVLMQGISAAGVVGNPGYTPPVEEDDTAADTGTTTSGSTSDDDGGSCFVSMVGSVPMSFATALFLLFAGIFGVVAVRRK